MFQRALQGYEKALGLENVARCQPALITTCNLGKLFATQGHLDEAKEMYSRARTGFQTLLGPSSNLCLELERSIAHLDSIQAGTHDNGVGVDVVDAALDPNAKKESRSVVRRFIRKLFR